MRVEVLSDHGGEQLDRSRTQMETAATAAGQWDEVRRQADADRRSARRRKPLWKRIFAVSTPDERAALAAGLAAEGQTIRAHHEWHSAHQRSQQQAAGNLGEDRVALALSALPDEWTLLRGYRNRRGETDGVLVGPHGIWAIEAKFRNVHLHVDGEHWWYDKYDRYGNVVERARAVDGGGRTWAEQVNAVAGDLRQWLRRNNVEATVRTAVVLTHNRSVIAHCVRPTVDLVTNDPVHLLAAVQDSRIQLPEAVCSRAVQLIHRDHRYHEKRRSS
ncbi:nuclease-related domain-containing protein [Cryptosporangium sp. NPDC048952]|uniref:nuclease-related domain-containing protein n=1 Tax=Cryptosporangium sp. NPDC048952 TaxID=3363961 RepID=UPI003718E429